MAVNINVPSQVKTYANLAAFPATGALKTIYIAEDTNKTYRWTGSVYTEISASAAMTWGAIGGTLSNQTDLQSALDAKVPISRTLTINGVTQDLSADRTFTISTGITIGSTAIASGVVGRVLFEGAGNVVQESANLFWDNTNNRLGIGTSSPAKALTIQANANDEGILLRSATGLPLFQVTRDGASNNTAELFQYSSGVIRLAIRSASNFSYFNGGNFGFGTTTDAGFRLDVNGTARVQGNFTLRNVTDELLFANATVKIRRVSDKLSLEGFAGFDFIDTNTAFTRMQIRSTGNVLINTTTDAGFRLDVNGTARVQGDLTLVAGNAIRFGTSLGISKTLNQMLIYGGTGAGNAGGTDIHYWNGSTFAVGLRLNNNANVLINTTTDVASAVLNVESTTKGFLPPRMTTTQKNAIASPAAGLMVYDTTLNVISYYNGSMWI